jgi:hypothetical protein
MTEPISLPRPKIIAILSKGLIVFLRFLVAAFLGFELGAMIVAAFNFHDWLQYTILLAGVSVCVMYGRNRLLLIFALIVIMYFVGLSYSRHKIAGFCTSITASTRPTDLTSLAEHANVDFRSFPVTKEPGTFYGRACDMFSVCDYGCVVEFDSNHVISSKTYSH